MCIIIHIFIIITKNNYMYNLYYTIIYNNMLYIIATNKLLLLIIYKIICFISNTILKLE